MIQLYADQVTIIYGPAPVREFDDPEQAKQKWIADAKKHDMPVDPSFWEKNPPESTALVNRRFKAALNQGFDAGEDYLRRLWMHAVAKGNPIHSEDTLIDLVEEADLDVDQFKHDLLQVNVDEDGEQSNLPFTGMGINGAPIPRIYYSEYKAQFIAQGLDEENPPEPVEFVEEHGPVATVEVVKVCDVEGQDEAVRQLTDSDSVESFKRGGERFWKIQE